MTDILNMTILGVLSGMIACMWTRIIKKNMIFRKFGRWLEIMNNRHLMNHTSDSMWVKFIRCMFCITPWLVLLFELWYIIEYTPYWMYCVIGTLGGLGAGNLVAEFTYALRNE